MDDTKRTVQRRCCLLIVQKERRNNGSIPISHLPHQISRGHQRTQEEGCQITKSQPVKVQQCAERPKIPRRTQGVTKEIKGQQKKKKMGLQTYTIHTSLIRTIPSLCAQQANIIRPLIHSSANNPKYDHPTSKNTSSPQSPSL